LVSNIATTIGINGIEVWKLINFDESGFYLSNCGSNYGRGCSCIRVRVPAHYTRRQRKVNVFAAIEPGNRNLPPDVDGPLHRSRRWFRVTYENYDQYNFGAFCNEVCTDIKLIM